MHTIRTDSYRISRIPFHPISLQIYLFPKASTRKKHQKIIQISFVVPQFNKIKKELQEPGSLLIIRGKLLERHYGPVLVFVLNQINTLAGCSHWIYPKLNLQRKTINFHEYKRLSVTWVNSALLWAVQAFKIPPSYFIYFVTA